ncbi:hypothetical protein K2173_022155 [Erythroxylum novogranatense]|uniref:Uncharacterized protein n=1 Tax=Erythroxylum novogranatense TaxID=1862640 RepID=A0AAV8STH2_9ROSI|nr:hypothetical protein K2173_022155 [Erythroxylum novogranatense]
MPILPLNSPSSLLSLRNFRSNPYKFLLKTIKHPTHFTQILSHAVASGLFNLPFVFTNLLFYSLSHHSSHLCFPRSIFFLIQTPNLLSYNFMFKAYSRSSDPVNSVTLYNSMLRTGVFPDNYTFPFVFKACSRLLLLQKGQEVHSLTLKLGFEFDAFVNNALISMYFSCGAVHIGRRVFDLLPLFVRDAVSWNSLISGYLRCDCNEDALKVFVELLGNGCVRPDEVSVIGAFTACGRMSLLRLGKVCHGLITVNGFVLYAFIGSSLVDMYSKCAQIGDARKVFDEIHGTNLVCWTSMIVGYARMDLFKEAIELFREMQHVGVRADAPLVACIISVCGHLGALDQGKWLHTYFERNGIDMNLSVNNALIDMYSKCGDVEKALQIFKGLDKRDVFSWTAMILGLAMNGNSGEALKLFAQMEELSELTPNEVTFLGVLSACSHGGFVDKGIKNFRAMSQIYHVVPRIEHYGCMVDLLGRANLLDDAERFIRAMPIQPDVVIWRSMLFACRSHGDVKLAEHATRKIEELEPRRYEAHVLLSNMYASASRWGDVRRVRKSMTRHKIEKQPGCSFIEINGLVHEFFAEDGSRSQMDVIYETNMQIHNVLESKEFHFDSLDHLQ